MKKFISFFGICSICASTQAEVITYLEEKTVFCYSEYSLTKYLNLAKVQYWKGLNELVVEGECNFVPDGRIFPLQKVRNDKIDDTPIIAFEKNDETLWTFKAFVKKLKTSNL